jgi:hypothetical protein
LAASLVRSVLTFSKTTIALSRTILVVIIDCAENSVVTFPDGTDHFSA